MRERITRVKALLRLTTPYPSAKVPYFVAVRLTCRHHGHTYDITEATASNRSNLFCCMINTSCKAQKQCKRIHVLPSSDQHDPAATSCCEGVTRQGIITHILRSHSALPFCAPILTYFSYLRRPQNGLEVRRLSWLNPTLKKAANV
eukprot:116524-Hanusia_phi.AAC.1